MLWIFAALKAALKHGYGTGATNTNSTGIAGKADGTSGIHTVAPLVYSRCGNGAVVVLAPGKSLAG
jgi:hypothetical protein